MVSFNFALGGMPATSFQGFGERDLMQPGNMCLEVVTTIRLSLSIPVLLGPDLGLVVFSLETEDLGLTLVFKAPERV